MEESAASESGGVAHYPPGAPAPKAADRIAVLRSPDRLAALNAGKAAFYALPKEERQKIIADRRAEKERKAAEREAKRAAKNGGRRSTQPASPVDEAPVTERSQRSSLLASPPDSEIPRPGVRGAPLRGLLDLCEALPALGEGSVFIQVTRQKPLVSFGVQCAGVQKPLWQPLDDAEFALEYGGGDYVLRGYQVREHGRAKALTEPVPYKVPGNPNPDSALTEEDTMRPQTAHVPNGAGPGARLGRPGLVTPHVASAEAEMFDRNLTHQETMDDRERRAAAERQQRAEQRERREQQAATDALRILSEDRRAEAERMRETYERQLEQRGGGITELAEALKILKPDGEQNQSLLRQHATEIKQLTEQHREQIAHLTEGHQAEVRRLTELHTVALQRLDDQLKAERDRSDKLIRETDLRAHEQVREVERRAEQRVTDAQNAARLAYEDLRTRSEERLRDQAEMGKSRLDDLREAHARELKRKDDELMLMRTNIEGNTAIVMSNKDAEIKRLERELREAKAAAEAAKDWVGQMEKAEQQALALGYEKPDPAAGADEDLKVTAAKAGLGMLSQLPQIIESATNAYRNMKNPPAPTDFPPGQVRGAVARGHSRPVPRSLGGGPPPVMLQPLPFATEDGGYVSPSDEPPARMAPPIALQQSPVAAAIVPAPVEQQAPAPQPQQQPPEPQLAAASAPQEAMVPAPAQPEPPAAPPSMAPPPPAGPAVDPAVAGVIAQMLPDLATAFQHQLSPADIAGQIIQQNGGPEQARIALSFLTVDQLLLVVSQDPTPAHSSLRTRNGQKFLRAIWQEAEKAVAQ